MVSFGLITIRAVSCLFMVTLPIAVAIYLRTSSWIGRIGANSSTTATRNTTTFTVLLGMGALCFVVSQVIHIPLSFLWMPKSIRETQENPQDFNVQTKLGMALFLGCLAGLCEEVSRWVFYRCWLQPRLLAAAAAADGSNKLSFSWVVMFGVGHGGCEALLVGASAIATLVAMILFKEGHVPDSLPPNDFSRMEDAVEQYWNASPWQVLMGPLERVFAMTLHVSLSLLVWRGFSSSPPPSPLLPPGLLWLLVAIAWHAAADAIFVFVMWAWGVFASESALALVFFPASIYIIRYHAKEAYADSIWGFEQVPQLEDADVGANEEDEHSAAGSSSEPSLDDEEMDVAAGEDFEDEGQEPNH